MNGWRSRLFQITHPHSDAQRRGQIIVSMALGVGACALLGLPVLFFVADVASSALALILAAALSVTCIWLARSGRISLAGWVMVIGTTIAVSLPMFVRNTSGQTVIYLIVPVMIASIVLRPPQLPLVLLGIWGLLAFIVRTLPAPTTPQTSINVSVTVLVMISAIIGLVNAMILSLIHI